jgi:hypothetical protein
MQPKIAEQWKAPEIETRPDGEQRFREAVRLAAKVGPKHRVAKPKRAKRSVAKVKR